MNKNIKDDDFEVEVEGDNLEIEVQDDTPAEDRNRPRRPDDAEPDLYRVDDPLTIMAAVDTPIHRAAAAIRPAPIICLPVDSTKPRISPPERM